MARPADLIVDATPLDGARIDVQARIGWLLRISRQVAGVPLGDVAAQVGELTGRSMSVAMLSRLERSGARNGEVLDGYEQALGLVRGRLRAPVDLICRTFPYSPDDEAPGFSKPVTLEQYDAAVGAVEEDPTGGDWMMFARLHDGGQPFGLPSRAMVPMLDKLAAEKGRSVGVAFITRQEALRRLRQSPYGDLVEELARSLATDPSRQVHVDLMSVLAERPTLSVLKWAAHTLSSDTFLIARGAAVSIERMAAVGGLTDQHWRDITPELGAAVRRAEGDEDRMAMLSSVFGAIPSAERVLIAESLDRPLPRPRVPASWTATRRNYHYSYVEQLAADACTRLGVPDQPMLTRLLFELLYDYRVTRAVGAGFLLLSSPFAVPLQQALEEAALRPPDATTRAGALAIGANMPMAWESLEVGAWLGTKIPQMAAGLLVLAGQGGIELPERVLDEALASGGSLAMRATYSAGMAQHSVLKRWARDEARPAWVRSAAQWWLAHGGRITL